MVESVNVDKLMDYIDDMFKGAGELLAEDNYKDALIVHQQSIAAIGSLEGLPLAADDIPRVITRRSEVHLARAEILVGQQLYRRAINDCTLAIKYDPNLAQAYLKRIESLEKLGSAENNGDCAVDIEVEKEALYKTDGIARDNESPDINDKEAEADRKAAKLPATNLGWAIRDCETLLGKTMMNRNPELLKKDELERKKMLLKAREQEYEDSFDQRVEEAQNRSILLLREQFEEVITRNGLSKGREEIAAEMAEYISRPDPKTGETRKNLNAEILGNIYGIDEDDAKIMLEWITKAIAMQQMLQ